MGRPATHAKGKVTTASKSHVEICWYLWLDCDAEKYVGNDPSEAAAHYALQAALVSKRMDDGLAEFVGITPTMKWSSGAGWQALIQLFPEFFQQLHSMQNQKEAA